MRTLPHTLSCFVCGEANPIGLRLEFQTDGRVVTTRFTPRAEHVGFKGVVHGGLIATLLDEVMVWACAVHERKFAVCAELDVRFLKPLGPGDNVVVTGRVVASRKGKIFDAEAILIDKAGNSVATAKGKYFPICQADLHKFAVDLVGDTKWLFAQEEAAEPDDHAV